MPEDFLEMGDIEQILEVTDAFGIHREKVGIPLGREDPGSIKVLLEESLEIIVPQSVTVGEWLDILRKELETLGFRPQGFDEHKG